MKNLLSDFLTSIRNLLAPTEKTLKIISGFIVFALLFIWYFIETEAEPWAVIPGPHESTRFHTLRKIFEAANQGFYFQLSPLIPMEHEWEDPGVYFLCVIWGITKRLLGIGFLNPYIDPYQILFFVTLLPFIVIYLTKIFKLPQWYWVVTPIFIFWAILPKYPLGDFGATKINGLLYLSISTRDLKVPIAYWFFTITIQMFEWWKQKEFFVLTKKRLLQYFVFGLMLGLFVSMRKDVLITNTACLVSAFFILSLLKYISPHKKALSFFKKGGIIFASIVCFFCGILLYQGFISGVWKIRDMRYPMQTVSRIYGRPVWHSLCAGLGVINNKYGIRWGDEDVWNIIKNDPKNKGVAYGTVEHERAARKLYFKLIIEEPQLFLSNIKQKISLIWFDHHNGLMRAFAGLFLLIILGGQYPLLALILFSNMVTSTFILIFVNPWLHYGLDFITHYRLAFLIGFAIFLCKLFHTIMTNFIKSPTRAKENLSFLIQRCQNSAVTHFFIKSIFKKHLLKILFIITVVSLVIHYATSEKDKQIDHSREHSIVFAIDAFNKNYPLYSSNSWVYDALRNVIPEYDQLVKNRPYFEPIETTWDDQGYFYMIYYVGQLKKVISKQPLKYNNLFIIQFLATLIMTCFVVIICNNTNRLYFILYMMQLFFLYKTKYFQYSLMGYYTYPITAIFMFYLALLISHTWNDPAFISKNKKQFLFLLAVSALLIGVVREIRADGSYYMILVGCVTFLILILKYLHSIKKRFLFISLCTVLFLTTLLIPRVIRIIPITDRQAHRPVNVQSISKYVSAHPIWISIFTGFGYIPNDLGFEVNDGTAIKAVYEKYGLIEYQSIDFEKALRQIVIDKLLIRPSIIWEASIVKMKDLVFVKYFQFGPTKLPLIIKKIVLLIYAHLFFGLWQWIKKPTGLKIYFPFISGCFALATVPVFIREPYWPYSTIFHLLLLFHVLLVVYILGIKLVRLFFLTPKNANKNIFIDIY